MTFSKDFIWGAAAASYQIEGNTQGVDGCGESIWDMVSKKPGFVRNGDTGFTACDHYNRYEYDVDLMKEIGLKAYRFSIMWPRVMPSGINTINSKGFAYYDKLVDQLLDSDIEPWITLFHWDYPQKLFQKGGWLNEDSSNWFADYVEQVVNRLSDRVSNWITVNEPHCFIGLGHQIGRHAPGLQLSDKEVNQAWHNALLAHGKAVQVIRNAANTKPNIGAAPDFKSYIPLTHSPEDIEAARSYLFKVKNKSMSNATWWFDPVFKGEYPEDGLQLFGADAPKIKDGDMEIINQELDFIGFNLYESALVKSDENGKPKIVEYPNDYPHTDFDWPVTPEALRWTSTFLYERYKTPIIVTENGLALPDWISLDGKVHDPNRIDFLQRYLLGVKEAINQGVDIRGYFQWSIFDNFEWALGYSKRFGLIHVDFDSQKRTIKDSGYWYKSLIESDGDLLGDENANLHWPKAK